MTMFLLVMRPSLLGNKMTSILTALLPLAIKLIALAIEKRMLSIEQKKAFLDFVLSMSQGENSSKKYKDEFNKLHSKLKEEKINE